MYGAPKRGTDSEPLYQRSQSMWINYTELSKNYLTDNQILVAKEAKGNF